MIGYGLHVRTLLICCLVLRTAAIYPWTLKDFEQLRFSLVHPHFVDGLGPNVLMRMGNPAVYSALGGPTISMPALTQNLHGASGEIYPDHNYDLIDVSLMHPLEGGILDAEKQAFSSFADQFVHWPTIRRGSFSRDFDAACRERGMTCSDAMQPAHIRREDRHRLAADFEEWDTTGFEKRVTALRAMLEEKGARPRVIFMHSMRGSDRVGSLFAAYAMRYKNMSLTEAIAANELIARRHMSYEHQVAAQWYCEHLAAKKLYPRGYDCGNCSPFRCWDSGAPMDPLYFASVLHIAVVSLIANVFMIGRCAFKKMGFRRMLRKRDDDLKPPEPDAFITPPATIHSETTPPRAFESYSSDCYLRLSP